MRRNASACLAFAATAALLASCQASFPYSAVRMGLGAFGVETASPSLTVQLDAHSLAELKSGQRGLQAVVSDISYVVVTVQPTGAPAVSQTITAAALAGGQGSASFNNLPAVATSVLITAYDAGSKPIGHGSQKVNVVAGAPTTISFTIPLDPTYIQATGGITTQIGFTDGPTIAGPPPVVTTKTGTVLQTVSLITATKGRTAIEPVKLAYDASGTLWVVCYSGKIVRLDPAGNLVDVLNVAGSTPGSTGSPVDLAFSPQGNAFVADYVDAVQVFSPAGKSLNTLHTQTLNTAVGIDRTGNAWVGLGFTKGIAVLTPIGLPARPPIQAALHPLQIVFDGAGDAYVLCQQDKKVLKLDPLGNVVQTLTIGGGGHGIALDSTGNLWVTTTSPAVLQKFDAAGGLVGTYKAGRSPWGVAVDQKGDVWVADPPENHVMCFSPLGAPVTTVVVGQAPRAVTVDPTGTVVVANYADSSITKIAP